MFTLVAGYQAVAGQTIQPSQHNPPLLDIATALTNSLPRDGAAPMTAQLKLFDGTAGTPGLGFGSLAGLGIFKSTNGIGFAVGGVQVAEIGANGFLAGVPIGGGQEFWGDTAPTGWVFAYGQAVSRTTYAALFAVLGTKYGVGDGSTTFNIPDKRGRASFGKDDMGGASANRITNQTGGWDGDVLGAAGGAETHSLTAAQTGPHTHSGVTGVENQTHIHATASNPTYTNVAPGAIQVITSLGANATGTESTTHNHDFTTGSSGSGAAHNNLPPGISCNYIIFAGV